MGPVGYHDAGRWMMLAVDVGDSMHGTVRHVTLSHNCGRRMGETFCDLSGLTVDNDTDAMAAIHLPELLDMPDWTADSKAAAKRYRAMCDALFTFAVSDDSQRVPYERRVDVRL